MGKAVVEEMGDAFFFQRALHKLVQLAKSKSRPYGGYGPLLHSLDQPIIFLYLRIGRAEKVDAAHIPGVSVDIDSEIELDVLPFFKFRAACAVMGVGAIFSKGDDR